MKHLFDLRSLLIRHHIEFDGHDLDPIKSSNSSRDPILDLVAQRAPGNREINADLNMATINRRGADHAQVNDAAMKLWILNRTQSVNHFGFGHGHICVE